MTNIDDLLAEGMQWATTDIQLPERVFAIARERDRRRRTRVRVAVGVGTGVTGVAAGLAVALTALAAPGGPHDPVAGPQRPVTTATAPQLQPVALITAKVTAALDSPAYTDAIMHLITTQPGLRYEAWTDLKTGTVLGIGWQTSDGQHAHYADLSTRNGGGQVLAVDYAARTWARYSTPPGPSIQTGHRGIGLKDSTLPSLDTPADVRAALQQNTVTLTGRQNLDGRTVERLECSAIIAGQTWTMTVYADAESSLPVQVKLAASNTRSQTVDTTTMSWLPRTPTNLSLLSLTPPPGFRHIAGPR